MGVVYRAGARTAPWSPSSCYARSCRRTRTSSGASCARRESRRRSSTPTSFPAQAGADGGRHTSPSRSSRADLRRKLDADGRAPTHGSCAGWRCTSRTALDALHAVELVHRESSPSTLLDEDGSALLVDWASPRPRLHGADEARTRYGHAADLAPELVDGGEASAASDLTHSAAPRTRPVRADPVRRRQRLRAADGARHPRAARPVRRPRRRPCEVGGCWRTRSRRIRASGPRPAMLSQSLGCEVGRASGPYARGAGLSRPWGGFVADGCRLDELVVREKCHHRNRSPRSWPWMVAVATSFESCTIQAMCEAPSAK